MNTNLESVESVDSYIAGFPKETQDLLSQMRDAIKKVAPNASEKISYGIPTFVLHGNLVHYAGYKNHIGFYPGGGGIKQFNEELSGYKSAKGSVQFPLNKPLPLELVGKITAFRIIQNEEKAAKPKKKK